MKDPKPLRWNAELTVAENSRAQLPAAFERYVAFGDEMVSHAAHPRELHRLRLATKHIRYSIEVFAGLFGPRVQDLLKILRETQQRLGAISDATATQAWLKKQTLAREPEALRLVEHLEHRAANQSAEFSGFWQGHFGAPLERRRWLLYLERYAGRSGQPGNTTRRRPRRPFKPAPEETNPPVANAAAAELNATPVEQNGLRLPESYETEARLEPVEPLIDDAGAVPKHAKRIRKKERLPYYVGKSAR